jgi:hypothetical protein
VPLTLCVCTCLSATLIPSYHKTSISLVCCNLMTNNNVYHTNCVILVIVNKTNYITLWYFSKRNIFHCIKHLTLYWSRSLILHRKGCVKCKSSSSKNAWHHCTINDDISLLATVNFNSHFIIIICIILLTNCWFVNIRKCMLFRSQNTQDSKFCLYMNEIDLMFLLTYTLLQLNNSSASCIRSPV